MRENLRSFWRTETRSRQETDPERDPVNFHEKFKWIESYLDLWEKIQVWGMRVQEARRELTEP